MKDPETSITHGPGRTRGMREIRAVGSHLNRQGLLPAERFICSETISGSLLLLCIPMATDIAFAVAIFAQLGRRVPSQLRIFLLTFAIAAAGSILVIAIISAGIMED